MIYKYLGAVLCLAVLSSACLAQDHRFNAQVTPFAGYRFGGSFEDNETGDEFSLDNTSSYGLAVNFPYQQNTEWEIYYSKQSTAVDDAGFFVSDNQFDIDVEYLQIGGTYLFEESGSAAPYFVATIGGARFSPQEPGTKSDTFFSFSAGGGWRFFPASRLGLRVDARLLGSFVDGDSKIFCSSGPEGGGCAISNSGKLLYQVELQLGLVFRF